LTRPIPLFVYALTVQRIAAKELRIFREAKFH